MADNESGGVLDDLDAFFSAASSSNPEQLRQAAQNVVGVPSAPVNTEADDEARPRRNTVSIPREPSATDGDIEEYGNYEADLHPSDYSEGKFIAVDADTVPSKGGDAPFILIPAHIHAFLPWWGWLSIGLGLLILIAGIALTPTITLNRLADGLGDENQANAQYAMRQLVTRGDERTVRKLYDMASSREAGISTRLRAVDTLTLIPRQFADRALLRLELSAETDDRVREAAVAARKQREASRSRTGR